jgi:hypothetical protein
MSSFQLFSLASNTKTAEISFWGYHGRIDAFA